jgi:Domain of unknown function (DUF4281)
MLETMFIVAQAVALAGWAPLFALPWVGSRRALLWARAAAALLCLLYLAYLLPHFAAIPRDAGYTLAALGRAFDVPQLLLAGWIHYLIFDLWVGAWQAEDAERRGLSHAALLPCLFATMMIGPLGLLIYIGVARLRRGPAAA